ncbi:CDP-glucose 4,6-dehydratase [Candidatus Pacearchaeota archaeon]|nr:CDP-glucose 4,6-dehydratase [Candidatus Pacearchaeota archaeon]
MVVNKKSFFKNKKILITGDTGFKGSWLAFWLHQLGGQILGYALPPQSEEDHFNLIGLDNIITHIDGNILDTNKLYKTFESFQPEIVFHLAAQALVRFSYDDPKLTFDTNVAGSVNVLEAVRKTTSVRALVYVTSDKCYKNKEWIWGYRENDELGGHDPYSASKAAAEIVISSYIDSFFQKNSKLGIAHVRAGNVIGGGDWAQDRIIPDCVRSIRSNKPIEMRNPTATRPWQHVLEPLSGYMLIAEKLVKEPKKYTGAWNFGPNVDSIKTVDQLSQAIVKYFGEGTVKSVDIDRGKHEANLLHLNCDKATQLLGWRPTWGFDKTVSTTAGWYKDYLNGENPQIITKRDIEKFMKEK